MRVSSTAGSIPGAVSLQTGYDGSSNEWAPLPSTGPPRRQYGILTLITAMGLFSTTALADDTESEGEETGYGDIVLTDGGPTEMEDKRDYENLVTLGFGFLPATVKADYRKLLNDNFSVMFGGGFGSANWNLGGEEVRFQRVIGNLGADYHPVGNGLHGFYVGPRVSYIQWSAGDDAFSSSRLDVRGIAGWRWVLDPGASIALGLGGKYQTVLAETGDSGDSAVLKEGIGPALEFKLGWAF
jgi:hypothetical protein